MAVLKTGESSKQEGENNAGNRDFLKTDRGKTKSNAIEVPSISLPKGGGAVKGIDEKFSVNAVNGTSSFSIAIPVSQARGLNPDLSLSYNSGAGNSIFGLGWSLSLPSIKRKTDKKLPQYLDGIDSDVFLFSESEDLVPEFDKAPNGSFLKDGDDNYIIKEINSPDNLFTIRFYKPRIEGVFARIERWYAKDNSEIKWRVITRDNIITLYGWSTNSRITDPDHPQHVYEWFPEFVFNDRGNCYKYIYKQEDNKGFNPLHIHNRNREAGGNITYTNLYLSRILYCNKTPYKKFGDPVPADNDFLFENIFDYGTLNPGDAPDTINEWDFRPDAFSEYNSGFEIRTTRLCKRILLFHHFTGANEYDGLVRSINFEYDTSSPAFTFLTSARGFGYIKKAGGGYSLKKLPPFQFEYQRLEWNSTVKTVSADALVHAPSGIEEPPFQFTDLFNEGLPGILTEQGNTLYYKHNIGVIKSSPSDEGTLLFEQAKPVSPKPSFRGLGSQLQLSDLDADGNKQLVSYSSFPKGFFELNDDNEWQPFTSFKEVPNIAFNDPYTKQIDLNGDGRPELLISEDNVFIWYESKGKDGFTGAVKNAKTYDEEEGPYMVFDDGEQTIFLADMSGDGLTDIVRIRNGEVCYWPNLGYGRFGKKVSMDQSPLFDHQDSFNSSQIKLSDIDGSGTADIIYLGKNKFSCWMNLSGNSFAATPFEIDSFPQIHSSAKITVTDLLGNGVPCIAWSSPLTKDAGNSLKYIDLANSRKPHVMVKYKNNLGKEVSFEYCASTKYYIDDKLAGNPWITKLHFPVHCVSKTITEDKITGHRFTSSYNYHHGYYDHAEREFRGFGMVEQIDGESFEHWEKSGASNITENDLHQEPVITKKWFHTGAFARFSTILNQYEKEYWYEIMKKQGIPVVHFEKKLDDAIIVPAKGIPQSVVDNISAIEYQQAMRACKSMVLRSEVFARDAIRNGNTAAAIKKELTPYTVNTHNCLIELLQPKGHNSHAIFIVKESEAINYSYERTAEDPRIAHTLNIKLDEYGNMLESATVVYERKTTDTTLPTETKAAQNIRLITYLQNNYTNDQFDFNSNRQRLTAEAKTYELKGVTKTGDFHSVKDFENILDNARSTVALYHESNKALALGKAQRRLIEHIKTLYNKNDLSASLPLYAIESKAISFESYQLAYTPELLTDIYGAKATNAHMIEGKFVHSKDEFNNDDANWWIRSGRIQYIETPETVTDAENRFYVPVSYIDPFNAKTKVKYYSTYFMMVEETEDQLNSKGRVLAFNFRSMTPARMQDANDNITEVINDELGLVKAMAVFGKGNQADDMVGLKEETDAAETALIQQYLYPPATAQGITDSVALMATASQLLKNATTRYVYDMDAYVNFGKPARASSIMRITHAHDVNGNPNPPTKLQLSFEYSSGIGNVTLKKAQAEPGIAKRVRVQPNNTVLVDDINISPLLRWIASGKKVVNNKGNVVKEYLPYFSIHNQYEDYKELSEKGVTPIMYYDAPGRLIRTEAPDGTVSKIEFDSWKQLTYDANDSIIESEWYKKRTDNTRPDFISDIKQQQAAVKASLHAGTPDQLHFDTLGRAILFRAHNKHLLTMADEFYDTVPLMDIEGNLRTVIDDRGNALMTFKYDMLGNVVYQLSMDAGERFLLQNAVGNPLRSWDARSHEFIFEYDILHRSTIKRVKGGDGPISLDHIYEKTIYGEGLPADKANNLRLKAAVTYDTAGKIKNNRFSFTGNALSVTRNFATDYKAVVDWSGANPDAKLDLTENFVTLFEYDVLARITKQVAPDNPINSIYLPQYNESGLLDKVQVTQNGNTKWFVHNIDYDEKAQRTGITYGNQVTTSYTYDEENFRLISVQTKRQNNDQLQDLYYTYDAAGNITHLQDKNIPEFFFNNQMIDGMAEYTYDALYRLREATGREHAGQLNFGANDNWDDLPFMKQYNPNDAMAWRNYTQKYDYDSVGNILQMKHIANAGNWTRDYEYETNNNRLKKTTVGTDTLTFNYNSYPHHVQHGFITSLPHLQVMRWNFKDELQAVARQSVVAGTPETTYYVYDSNGQRARKITEREAADGVLNPVKKSQRIYVGGIEIYREYDNTGAGELERLTYHVMDDKQRIAVIDSLRLEDGNAVNEVLIRYQLSNHLGSASIETDDLVSARVISYEEYHPYGTTSYQAVDKTIKAAAKRYRYTVMERDEESGLEYHKSRYYMPWLGRWCSPDPIGIKGGNNLYAYCDGRVITMNDSNGNEPEPAEVLSLGRNTLPSELATNGLMKGAGPLPMTEANAARATQLTGRGATSTVRGMSGFREVFTRYNSAARASGELVETALSGEGIVARSGSAISAVFINARGVELTAAAEKVYHTSAELGAIKRSVEAGKHVVNVFVEGESGLQIFKAGSRSISIASTVNLLAKTPVKSFAGARQIATVLKPLRPVATAVLAVGSKLAPVAAKLAPIATKLAPIATKLAPVGTVLGKVAGPAGILIGAAQIATAKDTEGKIDGGITVVSSALLMSKHPVAMAAGGGLMAGQVIEKTLDVSKHASDHGIAVYEGLKSMGANDTAALVAGGVVTVISTPVAIVEGAASKTASAAKSLYHWIAD